jgi:hypothetical protein
MRRTLLRRPSPAMIVACAALAVALGGTSYATVSERLARNSVGTLQLRNNAVTPAKIRDNAVTSAKVRDFSLRLWDFKRGDIPKGPAGPAGPAGVVGDMVARDASTTVPGNIANGLYVTRAIQRRCDPGERAIAGGSSWSSDVNEEELITVYSRPLVENGKPVGWRARGGSDQKDDRIFTVEVLCAKG